MNQHLQNILSFIEQDKTLSAEEKSALLKSLKDADKEFEITSFKLDETEKVKRTTAILLEETIEELEQKRKAVQAQSRELEIESSLERVRTVAMSMNKPDDMLNVCKTIALQLQLLGVKEIRNVQTAIFYRERGFYMNYEFYAKHDKTFVTETVYTNHEVPTAFAEQMFKGKGEVYTTHIKGSQVKDWLAYQRSTNVFIDTYLDNATSLNYYWHSLGPVALGISTYDPLSDDALQLFQRFLKVFDLSYRRYLDIEKAIAQAKEAQIETSLERVRAQAMAMRTPEDLTGICEVLYAELHTLGFTEARNAMINIYDDEKRTFVNYDYSDAIGKSINHLHYNIHPVIEKQIKQLRNAGEPFSETYFKGKDLEDMKVFRKSIGEPDDPRIDNTEALYYYFYSIGTGAIGISTFSGIAEEKLNVLKRFRNVFNLSYQRYTDIALAEVQAKEAKIELALERVRSRSLAMHNTSELQEVIHTVHKELLNLDIAINGGSFIAINNDVDKTLRCWGAGGTADTSEEVILPLYEKPFCTNLINHIKNITGFFTEEFTQQEKKDFFTFLFKYEPWSKLDAEQKKETLSSPGGYTRSCCVSQHTSIFIINHFGEKFSTAANDILQRFAKVFEQTYTRFLDLQKAEAQALRAERDLIEIKAARKKAEDTLTELQTTQKQLIQSEKMASLGELTAGIAHEIQNPLNFVNNFSEVSKELLDEMNAEIEKGDLEEAKAIANDIKQNLEKINRHGKRADAIVKGMLQHSQSSSGIKEPTDINKLADEYLRLAYHGIRAKDNSFNATLKTDFDESIGNINIIPQDIGRVVLNLITNAFYVVDEKKKASAEKSSFENLTSLYEPTISVSTKKEGNKILIRVKDNGNGIPAKVLDKIFQPFFTTKPTGQGTGLGLSLSYDIIKAHGGELKAETKAGEFAEFVITLPV